MAADKSSSKGQAWFCTTGLPSDVVVEVNDMTFHLHKFPLISRSKKLHDLITEQETRAAATTTSRLQSQKGKAREKEGSEPEEEEIDDDSDHIESETEEDQETCCISLPNFPGGSETFETAAKFCYGVKIDLNPSNVACLRCAGEVLEMTEEYSEDNLISKTERVLSQSVFRNIKDSTKALKSCESVMPLAENLGIVERCIDAISSKAALVESSLLGWPVTTDGAAASAMVLVEDESRKNSSSTPRNGKVKEPWFEDLAVLSLDLFKRLISAMRERELSAELIESCVIRYAHKCFPRTTRTNRKAPLPSSSTSTSSETEQRELLEAIVTNLPLEKSSIRSSTTTKFLFGLLRTANILNASESCKFALERKIGLQFEQATLDDLLIPSYSYLNDTLYDVECVERILGHFLDSYEERSSPAVVVVVDGDEGEDGGGNSRSPAIVLAGKLIDGYLSEIASDANLKPEKFCELAISLPEQARIFDDGLYRAVDVYLKAHPWISEDEREKISGVMDCQKLTLEACTHAAQNERLPLRAVVQVLFFEQLQLRHAVAGTLIAAEGGAPIDCGRQSAQGEHDQDRALALTTIPLTPTRTATPPRSLAVTVQAPDSSTDSTWRKAIRENQVLRLDMDSMRTRVHELERECLTMKKAIQKIDKVGEGGGNDSGVGGGRRWKSSLTRRFGCKFKTQVCDSHEPTVVETQKGRPHHSRIISHRRNQ